VTFHPVLPVTGSNTQLNSLGVGTAADGVAGDITNIGNVRLAANGTKILLGSSLDTDLYRDGFNSLKTDGDFTVVGTSFLTTTDFFGAASPAVVTLSDAATIAVDASAGNDFRVTIAASRTMGAPSNPRNGQRITFLITQGGSGSNTITWNAVYEFASGLAAPTLSTTAGLSDLVSFIYDSGRTKWLCSGYVIGYT